MERPHKCKICGKGFPRPHNLKTHMLSHTRYKRYKCPKCDKKFVYGQEYKIHLNIHNGIKPHKCNICNKSFLRRVELKIHQNSTIHAGIKPWKCKKCKKSFSQQPHLTAHLRSHTGDKPFKCVICPKTFTQSSHLNSHILLHTGEKPHECKICKLRYRLKTTLNSHMRTHTGDRPYKCPRCPRTFTQHSPLAEHIQKAHGNQEFPCSGCYKVFQSKTQLVRHEKSHMIGEFKYSCIFCGKGVDTQSDMWGHYRRHTKEKPYFCGYCEKSFYQKEDLEKCEKRHRRYGQKRKPMKSNEDKMKASKMKIDDVSSSFSPPPPLLVREEEPTSFEGLVTKSPQKDLNGNNEFVGCEKAENIDLVPEVNGDVSDDNRSGSSPYRLLPSPERGMEIDESVTLSPPSLDLEGEQDACDQVDTEETHSKIDSSGPIVCSFCQKTFTFKAQLYGHLWVHQTSKRKARLERRRSTSKQSRTLRVKTERLNPVASTPRQLTSLEKIQIKIDLDDPKIARQIERELAVATHSVDVEGDSQTSVQEAPISAYRRRKARRLERRMQALERKGLQRPFKCSQCQYSAQTNGSLELHIRLTHVGLECHKCKNCWKSFPTNQRLEAHNLQEHKRKLTD